MDNSIQSLASLSAQPDQSLRVGLDNTSNPFANAAAGSAVKTDGPLFTDVMSGIATDVVGKLQYAEKVSLDAVQGKANTREVVDSLMTAEQSLKTAIAIRDKIVTAYLDVTRMQI